MNKPLVSRKPPKTLCAYWPNSGKVTEMQLDLRAPRASMPGEDWRRQKFNQLSLGGQSSSGGIYHPVCPTCPKTEFCRATRVNLSTFEMSKSQVQKQRAFTSRVTINITPPHFDRDVYELYKLYVTRRHADTASEMINYTAEDFRKNFGEQRLSWIATARDKTDKGLIAAMLLDHHNNDFLAEYVVYDPRMAKLSPGISMMLSMIGIMKQSHPDGHMYLGSWSPGSPKLGYKSLLRGLEVYGKDGWAPLAP